MTSMDELATMLRETVDRAAHDFGGEVHVLTDEAQQCAPDPVVVWTYQVQVPRTADSPQLLMRTVAPRFVSQGWTVTIRDTNREYGVHFGRDGFDVGVMIGRAENADIVIGGSTPALPA